MAKDTKPGEQFMKESIKVVWPIYGLELKYYPQLIEKEARKELRARTLISFNELFR